MKEIALSLRSVRVSATTGSRAVILPGVDLQVPRGSLTAIVGESGSGKTTLLNAVLGLLPGGLALESGEVRLGATSREPGADLAATTGAARRRLLGRRIGYVPQDCLSGFDPLRRVGAILVEAGTCHGLLTRSEARRRAVAACAEAGIPEESARELLLRSPGQLSGGQRQRILIALARMHRPEVVLYDEPTSALDPQTKASVLESIRETCDRGTAALVVTHDLQSLEGVADVVHVMYLGRLVESGLEIELRQEPAHPYTGDLLACLPRRGVRELPTPIPGEAPAHPSSVSGCAYHPRCRLALDWCATVEPALEDRGAGRRVACHAR